MDSAIYFKYREFRQLFRHKNQNIEVFLQTYEKLKEEFENDYVKSFSTDQKDILEMLYVCNLDISLIEKIMIQHQTKSEVRNELLLLDNDLDTRVGWMILLHKMAVLIDNGWFLSLLGYQLLCKSKIFNVQPSRVVKFGILSSS